MFKIGVITGSLLATPAFANTNGSLLVDVDSVDVKRGGSLAVYVYTDSSNWLKPEKRVYGKIVPVTNKDMTVEIPDVPYGEYAVSVIQDLNGNAKIDMDWFPIPGPAEPTGVSNNAEAGIGAPSFKDAKFQFSQPKLTLSIALDI